MRGVLGLVAIVAGCYEPPRTSCAIQCTEGAANACPSGLTCSAGYCVGADTTCTTALGSVHVGARHACGLDTTGRALCWGDGHEGQIGVANVVDAAPSPVYVGEPTDTWISLSTGAEHTCAVKPDGTVWCWGENQSGEVRGPRGGIANVPAVVMAPAGVPKFEKVYAGGAHSCALGQGQAWCWGRKDSLGLASDPTMMTRMASPVTDFTELSTGQDHTCAISASTGVWCWGNNDRSQSGQIPTSGAIAPKMVAIGLPSGKVPIHITAGNSKTCVIMADAADAPSGDLWCWGYNQYGDLGPGGDPIAPAKQIATEPGWTAVAAGNQAICGLRDGNAYCWGTAYLGQLGDGVWSIERPPSQPAALGPADEIAVAFDSPDTFQRAFDELACLRDGTQVRCWGANRFGSAGIGTMAIAMTPVAIDPPAGHTWQHVWAGDDHTCAQTDDGALWCWGANTSGGITADLGRGTVNLPCTADLPCDVVRPMAAPAAIGHPEALAMGKSFTCALEAGAIDCWGTPDHGVLGASRSTPGLNSVTPPASQQWTKLFGGATASCGQTSGGTLSCWGRVVDADRTSPTPIASPLVADLTSLQFGDAFACGAEATGTRVCWGDNGQGQLGTGVTGGNTTMPMAYPEPVAKTSAHDSHACATTPTGALECWGQNYSGECGQPSSTNQVPMPSAVNGAGAPLAACTQVAAGAYFSCAICADAPWCWGDATELQLGRGNQLVNGGQDEVADRPAVPVAKYTEIAAGATHACALDQAGALYCWGNGPHGEVGNGGHAVSVPTLIAPAR